MENKAVKEIKISYADGTEKIVTRGVCFSVYDKDDSVYVSVDGRAGSDEDEIAVLAIISRIARELGIDEELANKAETGEDDDK